MELAIRRSDLVEIDVQRSKDGTLVNFHDCTMEPTTAVEEVYPGRPSYRVSDFHVGRSCTRSTPGPGSTSATPASGSAPSMT